jgi:tetratricopeptide (TPR) repeat protein
LINRDDKVTLMKIRILFFCASLFFAFAAQAQLDKFGQNVKPEAIIHLNQGKRYLTDSRLPQAVSSFEQALSHQTNYFAGHYNLGLAYVEGKEYNKGIASLLRALEILQKNKLKDATIYNSLGWAYLLAGQHAEAERYLLLGKQNEAQLSTASQARLYNNMGWLYLHTGQYAKARPPLEHAANKLNSPTAKQNLQLLNTVEKK